MKLIASNDMNMPNGIYNDINRDQNFTNTHRSRNDAGHDLFVYQIQGHSVEIHFTSPPQQTALARQTPLPRIHSAGKLNTSAPAPQTLSQSCVLVPAYQGAEGVSVVDAPIYLIVQIVQLLIKAADKPKDLTLELAALYESLVVIRTAIQENEDSPLGLKCLLNLITPEVNRCHTLLQELLDIVHGTWWGLDSRIGVLWLPVWQNRWDGNELTVLRRRLSQRREWFHAFQMALKSDAWTQLGNDLRTGHISLKRFYDSLGIRLPPLRHVRLEIVSVLDHLGQTIAVPTTFCSTWEGFNCIIVRYCKNRIGNRYVEQGQYQLISSDDNKKVDPLKLAEVVKPGMTLEMSIVVRQMSSPQDSQKKCPRCQHVNLNAPSNSGWIECCCCSGKFQVEKKKRTDTMTICPRCHRANPNATSRSGWIQCYHCSERFPVERNGKSSGTVGKDRRKAAVTGGQERGEENVSDADERVRGPGAGEESYEEVVSPASHTRQEDEAQYFRRINVIYTVVSTIDEYLRNHHVCFVIDDSGSMQGPRWSEARDALLELADHALQNDSHEIDIRFMNSPFLYRGVQGADRIFQIFDKVQPRGRTPMGAALKKVLNYYMNELDEAVKTPQYYNIKPLDVIVLTDGVPTDDPNHIIIGALARMRAAKHLKHHSARVKVIQVGDDDAAVEPLMKVRYGDAVSMVDVVPSDSDGVLTARKLEKTLLDIRILP